MLTYGALAQLSIFRYECSNCRNTLVSNIIPI
jgi:hypothetical protein